MVSASLIAAGIVVEVDEDFGVDAAMRSAQGRSRSRPYSHDRNRRGGIAGTASLRWLVRAKWGPGRPTPAQPSNGRASRGPRAGPTRRRGTRGRGRIDEGRTSNRPASRSRSSLKLGGVGRAPGRAGPETQGALPKALHRFLGLDQSPHVGQVPACLDGEAEAVGGLFTPAFESDSLRESVEGVVDLDGGKPSRAHLEPLPFGQILGIERPRQSSYCQPLVPTRIIRGFWCQSTIKRT